ncbi:DUF2062 domain-containing protein [Actibacterium sp. MT2.3-13A]|uniref:DUF2062 domain-containing protein n=1 Tax=Actibacterium sp. MT2.3-13A TaxID=2828332 RepID=UPI001BAD380F|nr:DUF2062 domain-containing protein [Actibacterium sp. MT2.3-13A]
MVFKRRDKRSVLQIVADAIYPKGGWARAFHYVKHRVRRLPDSPEKIARGVFAGLFATFTPFYGLHFVVAALVARLLNGNILAALMATFFGNPLTYLPIGAIALKTGHFLLGTEFDEEVDHSLIHKFTGAGEDLLNNLWALFTDADAHWTRLADFYHEVFFPYLIGGILPGILTGIIGYYLSVPLIAAYQKRRRGKLKKKLAELQAKAAANKADETA